MTPLAIIILLVACNTAYACSASCSNGGNTSVNPFLLCGTDGKSRVGDPDTVECLFKCNVAIMNAGTCECPNDCGSAFSRGLCVAGEGCVCWKGWTGVDCSTPNNQVACHGYGVVKQGPQGSYCLCEAGFGGSECLASKKLSPLPFGYLTSDDPCSTDPYCHTTHPIFNLSNVAVLNLQLNPESLLYLLSPANAYNGSWVEDVNVTLVQSIVSSHSGAKMKLGGSYSRRLAKKGWIIKLRKGDTFGLASLKVSKLKTKSGVNDGSYMNSVVITDAYRSLNAPVPRVCVTEVRINGIHQGVCVVVVLGFFFFCSSLRTGVSMLYEEVEKAFLDSWFGHSHGNLYKMDAALSYQGNQQQDYDGHGYSQESGDGSWTDFLSLITAINSSSISALEQLFDVDTFLRVQAVEAVFADGDGWSCSGHNSYLYNVKGGSGDNPYFVFFRHDLDDSFGLKSNDSPCNTKALSYWARLNLTLWGTTPGYCNASPLTVLILSQPRYRSQFLSYAKLLVDRVIVSGSMVQRVDSLYDLYAPYMVKDAMYGLDYADCGGNADWWYSLRNSQFVAYLNERAQTF